MGASLADPPLPEVHDQPLDDEYADCYEWWEGEDYDSAEECEEDNDPDSTHPCCVVSMHVMF